MAKGIDVRETQSGLFFRAFLQNSSGLLASSGTAQLAVYQLNYPDGGLLSYDFNDDTFKSGVLSSGLISMSHRTVNSGAVDTGLYTYRHTTLTNFVVRNIYFGRVIHSGALPYDQVREFQYGGSEGDGDVLQSGVVSVSGAVTLSGIPTNWSRFNLDTSGKVVVGSGPGNVSGGTPVNFNLLAVNASGQVDATISGDFPVNFARFNLDTSGKTVVGSGAVLAQVSGGVPANFTALAITAGGLVSVSGSVSLSGIPANWSLLNIDSSGKVVAASGPGNLSGNTPANFNLLSINASGQVDANISGGFPTNFARLNIDTSGKVVVGSGAILAQVSGGVPVNFALLNIDTSGKVVVGSGAVLAEVSGGVPANFPALAITAGGLVSVSGAVSLSGIPANWSRFNLDTSGKVIVGSGAVLAQVSGGVPANFTALAISVGGLVSVSGTVSISGIPANWSLLNIDTSGKVVVGSGPGNVSGGTPANFNLLSVNASGQVDATISGGFPVNFARTNIDTSGKVVVGSGISLAQISGAPANFSLLNIDGSGKVVAGSGVFNPTSGSLLIESFGSGVIRYLGDIQLIRNVSGLIEGSGPPQSLATVILKLTSRFDAASGSTFRCDGTTLHMTQTVTTGSGMTPIRALGVGA